MYAGNDYRFAFADTYEKTYGKYKILNELSKYKSQIMYTKLKCIPNLIPPFINTT